MSVIQRLQEKHRAYSGAIRDDVWWTNYGFAMALRELVESGLWPEDGDFAEFEQWGFPKATVQNMLLTQSVASLAKHHGSYDLLTAYVMRNNGVGQEEANNTVYKIVGRLEGWIEEILEND